LSGCQPEYLTEPPTHTANLSFLIEDNILLSLQLLDEAEKLVVAELVGQHLRVNTAGIAVAL
jgi:Tfp pilus assembly protein PilZ